MNRIIQNSILIPALLVAEVCIPISLWLGLAEPVDLKLPHLVAIILLIAVAATYIVAQSLVHATPAIGAGIGIWGALVSIWPFYAVVGAAEDEIPLSLIYTIVFAAIGALLGLVVALIAGRVRAGRIPAESPVRHTTTADRFLFALPFLLACGLAARGEHAAQTFCIPDLWPSWLLAVFYAELALRLGLLTVAARVVITPASPAARRLPGAALAVSLLTLVLRDYDLKRIIPWHLEDWQVGTIWLDIALAGMVIVLAGIAAVLRRRVPLQPATACAEK